MWRRIQLAAKPLDLRYGSKAEAVANAPLPQALITAATTGYALYYDFTRRDSLLERLPNSDQSPWPLALLGLVVLYSAAVTLYCVVRAFAIATKKKSFWKGRIHFVNGIIGTVAAVVHMMHLVCMPEERLEDRGIAFWSALATAFGYGVNNLIALPLLFTVHGHLSSLVRLLATGLFINIVLIANIIAVLFPGATWELYFALPMAVLSVLYCVAEVILGSPWAIQRVKRKLKSHAKQNGPLVALFKRGVQPHKDYFSHTVVTRFGFFLGIPPCAVWFYVLCYTDLAAIGTVDAELRRGFVAAMVWSCWQIAVGTVIATLVMRGSIKYERFYWVSDLFAVYAPFTGAALLWMHFRHTCSYVGFVFALWLPQH